eukprot:349715-Chlamydomonas_euryale.AAC.15
MHASALADMLASKHVHMHACGAACMQVSKVACMILWHCGARRGSPCWLRSRHASRPTLRLLVILPASSRRRGDRACSAAPPDLQALQSARRRARRSRSAGVGRDADQLGLALCQRVTEAETAGRLAAGKGSEMWGSDFTPRQRCPVAAGAWRRRRRRRAAAVRASRSPRGDDVDGGAAGRGRSGSQIWTLGSDSCAAFQLLKRSVQGPSAGSAGQARGRHCAAHAAARPRSGDWAAACSWRRVSVISIRRRGLVVVGEQPDAPSMPGYLDGWMDGWLGPCTSLVPDCRRPTSRILETQQRPAAREVPHKWTWAFLATYPKRREKQQLPSRTNA